MGFPSPGGRNSNTVADPSLFRFRAVVEGALAEFETRRREVNDLNVFPVADGDTGDNMALTLGAVLAELDRLSAQGDIDDIGRDAIVESVARAALLGASWLGTSSMHRRRFMAHGTSDAADFA